MDCERMLLLISQCPDCIVHVARDTLHYCNQMRHDHCLLTVCCAANCHIIAFIPERINATTVRGRS